MSKECKNPPEMRKSAKILQVENSQNLCQYYLAFLKNRDILKKKDIQNNDIRNYNYSNLSITYVKLQKKLVTIGKPQKSDFFKWPGHLGLTPPLFAGHL